MSAEKTLVLIKPDAMLKCLYGSVLYELSKLNLKMVGLKLVNVDSKLASEHYEEVLEKHGEEVFNKLIKHLTGEFHNNENVIAIVYKGENAIQRIRNLAGKTHPDEADPNSIRGRYGKIHTKTNVFENVVHASDSIESANKEISLWFKPEELVE